MSKVRVRIVSFVQDGFFLQEQVYIIVVSSSLTILLLEKKSHLLNIQNNTELYKRTTKPIPFTSILTDI